MICYIGSSPQVGGQQILFQILPIQVNISKTVAFIRDQWPSPNDPQKNRISRTCLSLFIFISYRIFDTKIQALRLAKVRPSSKSSPLGSVCPVMDRGEKMERPQPVGTGGTTFDYLQQHLGPQRSPDLRLWDCHGGVIMSKKWGGGWGVSEMVVDDVEKDVLR